MLPTSCADISLDFIILFLGLIDIKKLNMIYPFEEFLMEHFRYSLGTTKIRPPRQSGKSSSSYENGFDFFALFQKSRDSFKKVFGQFQNSKATINFTVQEYLIN